MSKEKIMIINPLDEDYNLNDGNIESFGTLADDSFHTDLLIDYGISVYGDESLFGLLKNMNVIPNVPTFFLTDYGNVVLLIINNGRKILLYLPEVLSKAQYDSLHKLLDGINYRSIELNHNLKLIDGIVESDTILGKDKDDLIIESFLDSCSKVMKKDL